MTLIFSFIIESFFFYEINLAHQLITYYPLSKYLGLKSVAQLA